MSERESVEIDRIVDSLELGLGIEASVADMAKQVHKMALDADYQQSRTGLLAAACVFSACRLQGVDVSLEQIAAVSREDKEAIRTTSWAISRATDLRIEPASTEIFMRRSLNTLGISRASAQLAFRLIRDVEDLDLGGLSPATIAACVLYVISRRNDLGLTQGDVSEAAGVSVRSIRNHYADIADALDVSSTPPQSGV